ncbi:MAG: MFS transporter [Eubacteriales bacterium]|nr:MFS transporter [Eubacteriales bacterium]
MTAERKNKIPFSEKLGYGIGALSYGIPFQLLSGCFVFYSTAVLHISGTLAGTILSLSIIWDALTDPVMGYVSDHTNKNILFGRRLFYVLIGAIGIAVSNYFLWSIDASLPNVEKAVLLGVLLLLVKTFSTVLTTPYLALGAELSSDYIERTSVQSFRTAFFFLGFMFPTVVGMGIFFRSTPVYQNGQLNPAAYSGLGMTASLIILVSAAICIFLTYKKGRIPTASKKQKSPFINLFRETADALKCGDFRNVSLSLLFINMAMGIVGAVGMHVFTYTFGFSSGQIAVVFGALFVMALAGQPVWVAVVKKFEKRDILNACLYINIAISLLFVLCVTVNSWIADHYLAVLPLSMLIGISMGGSIALPYAMISDTIDKDAYFTGTRKEGVFYGCATFMYKVSQALSVLFVGALLDIIGFDSDLMQTRSVYLKLGMILPVGFLVCFTLALFFAKKYTLDRESVAKYQENMSDKEE